MNCPACERWSPDGAVSCECGADLWEASDDALAQRRSGAAVGLFVVGGLSLAGGLAVTLWEGSVVIAYGAIATGLAELALGAAVLLRRRG